MKFTCPRERLLSALQAVSGVVPTHGIKDVHESLRISASRADGLRILGTDLEVSMRYTVAPAEDLVVEEEGVLLAPAKRLLAIVSELPEGPVTVAWGTGSCSIRSTGGTFRITCGDPADFPAVDIPEASGGITLSRDVLKELVQRTAFAAAKEKMRYALHGILLITAGDRIQAVATDGRRLAHATATCQPGTTEESRAIVPTRALTQLVRTLRDEDSSVVLSFSENHVAASAGPVVIVARLVEGTFPNFDEVIPVNCERKARLDRERFVAALRRAAVLFASTAGTLGPAVRLKFAEGEDLSITASVTDVGEAEASVPCTYEGKPEDVGYNAAYILDALGVISTEEVSFEFNSRQGPGRLSDGDRFTYVVMPVTLE